MIGAIRTYQKTHILRAPSCRFYPSCSQYMLDSIQQFGLTRGSFLGLSRLCRCHPLSCGGVDEVPTDYPLTAKRLARRVERLLTSVETWGDREPKRQPVNLPDITYLFMIPMLEKFAQATNSYGWAIVLLTLLVRMLVWPLVANQTRSMSRMTQLQPQMKAIQGSI